MMIRFEIDQESIPVRLLDLVGFFIQPIVKQNFHVGMNEEK